MKRFFAPWRREDRRRVFRACAWLLLWSVAWPALVLAGTALPPS